MKHIPFVLCLLLAACAPEVKDLEEVKLEVAAAEKAFNDMAQEKSIKEAFLAFSAEDAVMNRNGVMVIGKEAMADYFDRPSSFTDAKLTWTPEFIDVAQAGDMAYTYGPYSFTATDTTGNPIESSGYFHTVWKRQADGSWKFVYD